MMKHKATFSFPSLSQSWVYLAAALICWMIVAGCGKSTPQKGDANSPASGSPSPRQKVVGNALPPRGNPQENGFAPREMKLESLSEADFLAKFRYRAKPMRYYIGTDFIPEVDPTLYHFERVEVETPEGKKTEIRMQDFGAWAIWKNEAGNWEMLTTMVNPHGVMMHFHTLNPLFESLGSFEIARRTTDDAAVTIRRGTFTNEQTYEYTMATRTMGALTDSIRVLMAILPSGTYKVISETQLK